MTLQLVNPGDDDAIRHIATLFREYEIHLNVDLCVQNFAAEIAALPGVYCQPTGVLVLGHVEGEPIACGAVRPLTPGYCEMKRLFVRPHHHCQGYGRTMALRLIEFACTAGYAHMRLDTLRHLTAAVSLYQSLGFIEIPPYNDTEIDDIVYFELALMSAP